MALSVALSACNDDLTASGDDYIFSKEDVWTYWSEFNELTDISAQGVKVSASFYHCGNTTLSGVPSWATASNTFFSSSNGRWNEQNVYITVKPNLTPSQRIAVLLLMAKGSDGIVRKAQTEMSQNAGSLELSFVSEAPAVSAAGQTIQLEYSTNGEDSKVYVESESTWLTATKGNNSMIEVTVDTNSGTARSSYVYLRYKGESKYARLLVSQSSPTGSFDEKTTNIGYEGGIKTAYFTAESDWKISNSNAWLSVTPVNGEAGAASVRLSVAPNYENTSREGTIYLRSTSNQLLDSYKICQEGLKLQVDATKYDVDCANDGALVKITSNADWEVKTEADWLTPDPKSGHGDASIMIKAADNPSITPRKGKVTISLTKNAAIERNIVINQAGVPYGVDKDKLSFPWVGQTQKVHLSTPSTWNCAVSESWISVDTDKGSGEYDLAVTCAPNNGAEERSGYIMVKSEGEPLIINIIQQGQYFYLDNTGSELGAMGGQIELTVHSSVGAQCAIEGADSSWLTFEQTDAEGVYVLTAAYNNSINGRKAAFVIMPTMDNINQDYTTGVKYTVKQNGRRLISSVPALHLSRTGGQSTKCRIVADGEIYVYKEPTDTWYILEYDPKTLTFFVTATENKTGAERKGSVHLELKALPDGQNKKVDVAVIQANEAFDVDINDFGDEVDWN